MRLDDLTRHRVVILGWGREGQATHRILQQSQPDASITVWAERGADDDPAIQVGAFDERLMDYDVAIRSPGIPVDHPALQCFRTAGGRVINPSSIWFSEHSDLEVIGVTGSKGKSTTASLVGHLLAQSGRAVRLAGNIGQPLIGLLDDPKIDAETCIVVELSSYQLADLEGRLAWGVITRLFPEHVDWHGSVEQYYQAKLHLMDLAAPHRVLINARDPILMAEASNHPSARLANPPSELESPELHRRDHDLVLGGEVWMRSSNWALPGRHNLDNGVLALSLIEAMGYPIQDRVPALSTFKGLAHRLEVVYETHEWVAINDSIATTPHATLAALEALEGQPVVLIVGGQERGGDWVDVAKHLHQYPLEGLVALPDNGQKVVATLEGAGVCFGQTPVFAQDMAEAVWAAQTIATSGGSEARQHRAKTAIVLSPGAPSFGHYVDFEDRGRQFSAAIRR